MTHLQGQLLIAMPGIGDPRFDHAVIYLCAHSSDGAMGLIVNKPAPQIRFSALLDQLDIASPEGLTERDVYFGGPVEHGRGFVLHTADYDVEGGSLHIDEAFTMTATVDVLHDLAQGTGPQRALLALGYAGWGPGQLESELQRNGWLIAEADPDLIFATDSAGKWAGALRSLSIDPLLLSATGGSA